MGVSPSAGYITRENNALKHSVNTIEQSSK